MRAPMSDNTPKSEVERPEAASVRKPWVAPALTQLPPLTELTLQTGGGIGGGGSGGSTVFG